MTTYYLTLHHPDPSLWSMYRGLQLTTNRMWDHRTPQDTTAQQCPLGYHFSHAQQVTPTLRSKYLFLHHFFFLADFSCQPIGLFVSAADHRYGPISTIRCNGRVLKHIPWAVFTITESDWERVRLVCDILAVKYTSVVHT
jgi:hypothetical protein